MGYAITVQLRPESLAALQSAVGARAIRVSTESLRSNSDVSFVLACNRLVTIRYSESMAFRVLKTYAERVLVRQRRKSVGIS